MASLSLPTPAEVHSRAPRGRTVAPPQEDVVLVVGFGDPVAADYAAYVCRQGEDQQVAVVADEEVCQLVEAPARPWSLDALARATPEDIRARAVVLFLSPQLSEADWHALQDLLGHASAWGTEFLGIVSSFQTHLGAADAVETEAEVLSLVKEVRARTVVFRPSHVLSRHSRTSAYLRRLGFSYPLVPRQLRSCCLDADELFVAIESERAGDGPRRPRPYTLLGPNLPWRDLLAQHRGAGLLQTCLTAACALLALSFAGYLAALVLAFFAKRRPGLRRWNFDTLQPRSLRELLALVNKYNYRHVKVVGYNNGVVHFGHRYPGKTVVSTVHCDRVAHARADILKADCGATVRKALDFLAGANQELPVVPNYSYVCLGTALFVPIHGSAAEFSTVADTITRVVLYDPVRDRLIATNRDEPAFRDAVYNLQANVLLLRLYLRVKPMTRYYVHRQMLHAAESGELLRALRDDRATNVEIRKSSASSDMVTLSKYYNDPGQSPSQLLELPRDALGRLWDRLEEKRVTSFLMHALTRYFAWHVELFFTAQEFALFWKGHRELPLRKLQLRYIRRDGLPHSPFRDHDCVSVDLFMLRRHRRRFEAYLKTTFPIVRTNPGKHSA